MSRKKLGAVAFFVLLGLFIAGASVFWALFQVPDFYEQVMRDQVADRAERQEAAKHFVQQSLHLVEKLEHSDRWSEEFTQKQINSWLAEELHQKYSEWVPPDVYDPRVKLTEELIQIGFRYEDEQWQGVLSLHLRPWVPKPNQLAIEIHSIRAGLLPIPLEEVLGEVSKQFRKEGWRLQRSQVDGKDVVVVHLNQMKNDEQAILEAVEVEDEVIRISGSRGVSPDDPSESNLPRLADQAKQGASQEDKPERQ